MDRRSCSAVGATHGFGGPSAARAWDTSTGEELWQLAHHRDVNEITFSRDGEYVATADWAGIVKIVDRSGRVVRCCTVRTTTTPPTSRSARTGAWWPRPSGPAPTDRVRVWDWTRGEVLHTIPAEGPYPQVDFDPSGPRVVVSGSDGLAEIWDVESGQRVALMAGPSGGVNDLVFSPDGSRVATASVDGRCGCRRGNRRPTVESARVRMRCVGRRLQSGRREARLHELVRRRPDLGPRHRRSSRDRAARGRETDHRRGVPPVSPCGSVPTGLTAISLPVVLR